MTPVRLINRLPHEGQFSIENIFAAVADRLRSEGREITYYISPKKSKGVWPRLYNAWHMRRHSRSLDHIVGDVTYLAVAQGRNPLIVTFHDLNLFERKSGIGRWVIGTFWYRIPIKRATKVTAISAFTKQALINQFGVKDESIRVIPNPVPPSFSFESSMVIDPAQTIEILHIGTKRNKNLDRVVHALESLSSEYKIRLTVVGKLESSMPLREGSSITIQNFCDLSLEEMVALYRRSHIVVFPSLYEGFGMPVLEAQAVGRPVVTSDLEPMSSVSGGAAVLVDPYSIASIAEAVVQLIEDPQLCSKLVMEGRENAAGYSIEAVSRMYGELYDEVG